MCRQYAVISLHHPECFTATGRNELTMLVGTYTSGNSKGIYTFRFNQETGSVSPLSEIEVSNPSYLTLSADNRFVYAVSEQNDSAAAVHAFPSIRRTGRSNC